MNVLFLTSCLPKNYHSISNDVVLNCLINECKKKNKVFLATVGIIKSDIEDKKNFSFLGDFSSYLKKKKFLFFNNEFIFQDIKEVSKKIKLAEMDKIILFWDTWFDLLDFENNKNKVSSYLAKPRFSNALSELKILKIKDFITNPRMLLNLMNLFFLKNKHYRNLRGYGKNFNICKVDTRLTNQNKVKCEYLPNTWPDFFGRQALMKRKKYLTKKINILANIGNFHSTGNKIGMSYLNYKILPNLKKIKKNIVVNLCGKGKPNPKLKNLNLSFVKNKGFVKDLDLEVLKNQIFLLCNNTGYHYGGYTRVVYLMSSAGVLIADKNLSKSMPELIHKKNCLLSSSDEQMFMNLSKVINSRELREEIGKNARSTYEENYAPKIIVEKLLS